MVTLKNGGWVSIIGIEQTNLAWLTKRRNTKATRMIEDLNELLREHTSDPVATATTVP